MKTDEVVEKESWFRKSYSSILWILAFLVYLFIEDWINAYVYFGLFIVFYTNLLFFTGGKSEESKTWFVGSNSWLRANLIAFGIAGALFIFSFFISKEFIFLSSLLPENVSSVFPAILLIGSVFYLIGLGFYLIEKSTKN